MKNSVILFVAFVLIASCAPSLVSKEPQSNLYILNPVAFEDPKIVSNAAIEVVSPDLPKALESERIALIKDGQELDYYATIRWAGRLDGVFQEALTQSFEARFDKIDVGLRTANPNPNYRLITQIRDFQAEYNNGDVNPMINVSAVFTLLSLPEQEVMMRVRVSEKLSVEENRGIVIAKGFEDLSHRAMRHAIENFTPILRDNR